MHYNSTALLLFCGDKDPMNNYNKVIKCSNELILVLIIPVHFKRMINQDMKIFIFQFFFDVFP